MGNIHAGHDLNRVWNDPNIAHPTVKAAKNVVEEIISNNVIEDMTIGVFDLTIFYEHTWCLKYRGTA